MLYTRSIVVYVSYWDICVWQISSPQLILYCKLRHCKIMTKFSERTQNPPGEPAKAYMPDVPSPRYQSWSIKTAVAKHLWKSDPRLFELYIQRPRDPKSMTVFSNLPEVMEQNLGRARSIPQSPAAQIAAVATVASSLLTRATLNLSCFSHKSSVRALCTRRQRDLTSPDPCTWLLLISNNSLSVLVFRGSQRDAPHAAAQGPTLTMVSISQHPCQTASMALLTHFSWKEESKNSVLQDPTIAASTSVTFMLHAASTLIFQSLASL